jgi:hypothetical protein
MPSTGEVFTADEGTNGPGPRLKRFDGAGIFQSAFALDGAYQGGVSGLAVDGGGSGAVYVATGFNGGVPSVVKYSLAGVKLYALDVGIPGTSISPKPQVAVDPVDGTVYVTASGPTGWGVASFDASGGFLGFLDGAGTPETTFFCSAAGLAVDGAHRVYVLNDCVGRVDRFVAGAFDGSVDVAGPLALAVDPASSEVYVAHAGPVGLQVTHLSAGGAAPVYTFAATEVAGVRAMAVSGAGTVYTSDATDPVVERFVLVEGPTVVTGGTSSVEARSAVMEGTINPEGVASSYHFEYGLDQTYGERSSVVDTDAGSGSVAVAAAASVDGLQPNMTYHYRLVGTNATGSIAGDDATFTTLPAAVDIDSPTFASAIAPRSARLHATVNPNNTPSFTGTVFHFEYGTTVAYGSSTDSVFLCGPLFGAPCGGSYQAAISSLSGLEPGTTYHFRLVVTNGIGGDQFGADQTFVTAPGAGGGGAEVTTRRATLTGTINPHDVATTYHFNYGPTTSYGARTPEVDGGSGNGDRLVSHGVSGLLPDTIYHVQVVATSADGVVRTGADGLFRTAPAPTAVATVLTGASIDAMTLGGEVNSFGKTGSYHFDVWSLNSSYTNTTAERSLAGSASAERVSAVLAGLPPGETFAVQLTVSSNDSVGASDAVTFATPLLPRLFPAPPLSGVYGCVSPRLDAYRATTKPGDTITVTGQDLGVGGSVTLGDRALESSDWSATGFKVLVPEDSSGTLALTVDCGHRSNTIAVAIFREPDNGFAVTGRSVVGSTATLRVRVPGPGKIQSAGSNSTAAKVTVKRSGTVSVKVRLSRAGVRALGRAASRTLKVRARVRFTPAGGRPASKTVTLTFKRGSSR